MNGTVTDFDLDRRKRRTWTGSGDAFSAVQLETRAMVCANQLSIIGKQELIRRPIQRASLVGATIEVGANIIFDPENRNEAGRAIDTDPEFTTAFRWDLIFLTKELQIDSPDKRPHVDGDTSKTGLRVPLYISPPPRNPLTAAIAAVFGAIVLAGAFFLGFFVLLVVAGIGLMIWLGLVIRFKWLERKLRKQGKGPWAAKHDQRGTSSERDSAIEGEFTVVSRDRED